MPMPSASDPSNTRGRLWTGVACLLLGLALSGSVAANDSGSELAAGGIVLVKNDVIAMQREDLTLSLDEVRVRYEMRNDSGRPVTLRVAFPLPELPAMTPGGRTTTAGGYNIPMAEPREANFIGFRVWSDGREVTPEVEIRATLPDGRDVAPAVRQIGGLPLVLRSGLFFPPDDADLDAEWRRRLAEAGAIEPLDGRGYRLPWTTFVTFHWMQTFAPGVTVVEHSYRPIVGFQFFKPEAQGIRGKDDLARDFCIDDAEKRRLHDISVRARERRLKAGEGDDSYLFGYTLGYVLQTAKNWRGPIGTFHLTVKDDSLPANDVLASKPIIAAYLCSQTPLGKTAALRLEGEAKDFVPAHDLRVLFVAE
jgi:hypothetical protein